MAQEFFGGKEYCINVKVKMIYDGEDGDIINQYVILTKICNEQMALYRKSQKAVLEAIRICKDKNVLKEYLSSKEKEVVDIMMVLYDEQEVMRSYVESEVHEARYDEKVEMAKRLLRMKKLSYGEIAVVSELTLEEVEKLAGLELV